MNIITKLVTPISLLISASVIATPPTTNFNVSLLDAVSIAQSHFQDGRVVNIELENVFDTQEYEVRTALPTGELWYSYMDPNTGNFTRDHVLGPSDVGTTLWWGLVDSGVYLPIEAAIVQAMTMNLGLGVPFAADFDSINGKPSYEVDLIDYSGKEAEYRINAAPTFIPMADSK